MQHQSDLVISLNRIGDTLMALGRAAEGLAVYRQGLVITEALAVQDAKSLEWQRALAISLNRVGDVVIGMGQRDEALALFRRSQAIRERLAVADPGARVRGLPVPEAVYLAVSPLAGSGRWARARRRLGRHQR